MAPLLKIVGALWALAGVANIVMMLSQSTYPGGETVGLIFNMVLFIVPGLILAGLGTMLANRKQSQ